MNADNQPSDTDAAWEEWGSRDPYFGVLTNPKFRRGEITADAKHEFFESGRLHVDYLLHVIRNQVDANFIPRSILDFGCGVGRTLVYFAKVAEDVVGLDVSPSMLGEAERNCRERGLANVRLLQSDDLLSSITQTFSLIHSCIVFQHIPIERGREIFNRLLNRLAPHGIGAFHFLYSKAQYVETFGIAPKSSGPGRQHAPVGIEPEIQMNPYNLNEILFLVQRAGVQRLYSEFTDHGGELGLFLFFQNG